MGPSWRDMPFVGFRLSDQIRPLGSGKDGKVRKKQERSVSYFLFVVPFLRGSCQIWQFLAAGIRRFRQVPRPPLPVLAILGNDFPLDKDGVILRQKKPGLTVTVGKLKGEKVC